MSGHDHEDDARAGVGSAYAAFQLSKALTAQETHPDPAVRARAAERVMRWRQVLMHSLSGTADYGARAPLADTPAWVTLEVATGGFATGGLMAGGALAAHEQASAANIAIGARTGNARLDGNTWFLGDAGVREMQTRLESGDYAIDVPEEAALPIVAWLLGHGHAEAARTLLETLAPFFGRLRFHPPLRDGRWDEATQIHVFDTGDIAHQLAVLRAQPRLAAQQQAVDLWLPLYDEAVALGLEIGGSQSDALRDSAHDAGPLAPGEDGRPGLQFPAQWRESARTVHARYETAQQQAIRDKLPGKDPRKHRVAELCELLGRCARDPQSLTRRELGRIRKITADFVGKHGDPRSAAHRAARERQRRDVAAPPFHRVGLALSARLRAYPPRAGIADFTPLLAPITQSEAEAYALLAGAEIPAPIGRRLRRCRSGSIAELTACGLITSGETIARVLPRLSAEIRSAGFEDAALRRLYAATYRAFRRRRSLLLLNLQHQVALEELPWIAAIEPLRQPDRYAAESARRALREVCALTIAAFPYAPLPNKLLQELRALCKAAALDLPLTDELAADIFMGEFSGKFIEAARRAARVLDGSLYARYYAIDTAQLAALPDKPKVENDGRWWLHRKPVEAMDPLAELCAQRAGVGLGTWHPATNGMVLEQQQILTTHNLAVLFDALELDEPLRAELPGLAHKCFEWVCMRQQMKIDDWHPRLIMLKNTAYAWRQMVFFLSRLGESEAQAAIDDMLAHFEAQTPMFRDRFRPALLGLLHAATGHRLNPRSPEADGARIFLGWSAERHWLLDPRA